MNLTERWEHDRKYKRIKKHKQTDLLLKKYSSSNDYIKMHDLTELYLECFDLMTKIGIEISSIADNDNKEGY